MANELFSVVMDKVEELKNQFDWLQDEFNRTGDIEIYTSLYNETCQLEDDLVDYPNSEEKFEMIEELKGLNKKIKTLIYST